jgi:hypothetical protein
MLIAIPKMLVPMALYAIGKYFFHKTSDYDRYQQEF